MLELTGISKRFGGVGVVSDVSLAARPGEFFSLLGPSGCGKTTLLRIAAGFESPDNGTVNLAGKDVTAVPAYQRRCNMIFQRYALFPHLDVGANVAFGPRVHGLPKREAAARVAAALELVSMTGYERRGVETLSGGQQQRVAIARAIVNRPAVLLLDEPLSALDLELRQRMQVELLALQRRLAMTFVYVTHAQDEALTLSDRIAVMNGGRIEQVGTPRAIYDHPETPFVATFIGQMNRLCGRVTEVAGGLATLDVGLGHGVSAGVSSRANAPKAGAPATVLIRPERLWLPGSMPASRAATGPVNSLTAIVTRVLFKGAALELHSELAGGIAVVASLPQDTSPPEPGARITLAFAAADALAMDGEVPP